MLFEIQSINQKIESLIATNEDYEQFWGILESKAKNGKGNINIKALRRTNLNRKFNLVKKIEGYQNPKFRVNEGASFETKKDLLKSINYENPRSYFKDAVYKYGFNTTIKTIEKTTREEPIEDRIRYAINITNISIKSNIYLINLLIENEFKIFKFKDLKNKPYKSKKFIEHIKKGNTLSLNHKIGEVEEWLGKLNNEFELLNNNIKQTFIENEKYEIHIPKNLPTKYLQYGETSFIERIRLGIGLRGELSYILDSDSNKKYLFIRSTKS